MKIHDAKDPSTHLGPMFRQVTWTLFSLMEMNEDCWKGVTGSTPLETFGMEGYREPEPVHVDIEALVEKFKVGFSHFGVLWKEIFSPRCYRDIEELAGLRSLEFTMPVETWVGVLYELAATFHAWKKNRHMLVELVEPLYYGRVASFVNETRSMDSFESEKLVEDQARAFEEQKGYLISIWDEKGRQEAKATQG